MYNESRSKTLAKYRLVYCKFVEEEVNRTFLAIAIQYRSS